MTITFSMTAQEVATRAARDLGVIGSGRSLRAAELVDALQVLNAMLKSWGADGITLWTDIDGTATITAADPDVVLSPRPLFVTEARLAISATNERTLAQWEQEEYARLPNKAAVGSPSIFSLRHTPTDVTMRVWPVPSSDMTVKYGYARVINDINAATDTLDVPQAWLEGVCTMLAARLIPMFGLARIDAATAGEIKERARAFEVKLQDFGRPGSYDNWAC